MNPPVSNVQASSRSSRRRPFLLLGDSAVTASVRPRQAVKAHLSILLNRKSRSFDKASSVVQLFDRVAPGSAEWVSRTLSSHRRLPFRGRMGLCGFGTGTTVFILESDQGKKALKILRGSLGLNLEEQLQVAREYRRKYRMIKTQYNRDDPLVVPSSYIVMSSPVLGMRAAAVIQPYIPGPRKDLLQGHSDEELLKLFDASPRLRRQFLGFAGQFVSSCRPNSHCLDVVGEENVLLVEEDGHLQIRIIDTGIFDLDRIRVEARERYARFELCLERIRSLLERIPARAHAVSVDGASRMRIAR